MKFYTLFFLLLLAFGGESFSADKTLIRLGILPFGTVNWELTALNNAGLAENENFRLDIQHVANPQAGKIALQSGAVDIIVSDWIWVSKQRAAGTDFSFYPYSNTAGALLVAADSPIHSIRDLKDVRLGIAGGELDKNWLLLQALAMKQYQLDLDQTVTKVFAAPPLLNQQLLLGRVDAMINYWHYAARLEAEGYRQIIDGNDIQKGLGITVEVPTLGYVFRQNWAETNRKAVDSFFRTTRQSKDLLCDSDAAWQQIIPLTKAEQPATQQLLRRRFCQGRIKHWGNAEQQAAAQIYALLRKFSNNRLTGSAEHIQAGTFWPVELP